MRRRIRNMPSPSMVVAFTALLLALGGTAVALPGNNTVTSGDIVRGGVRSSDIKNNTVRSGDIRNSTVRGRDVRNNSLTGADINESTLRTVPRAILAAGSDTANRAANADSLGGSPASAVLNETIPFSFSTGEGDRQIAKVGPLTLSSNCDLDAAGNDEGELRLTTSANNSTMDDNNGDEESDFDVADNPAVIFSNSITADGVEFESTGSGGGVIAAAPDGSALATTNEGIGFNILGRPNTCYFGGVVVVLGGSAS